MKMTAECLLEESTALIAILDENLACAALSLRWRQLLGLTPDSREGLPLERLLVSPEEEGLNGLLTDLLDGAPSIVDRRVQFHGADGPAAGRLSAWRSLSADSRSPSLVVVVGDSSELERALRDLTEVEAQHNLILGSAGEGIYGLDINGRLTFGNAASVEILGWKVEEILGQSTHDVHHHSHADGAPYPQEYCPIYAALKDGEVHRVDDEVFWHTNGKSVPVEYTSTPIIENGRPNGAVVIFRDISERKTAERERENAYAEIQQLKEQLELERDYLRDEVDVTMNFGQIIGESMALKRTLANVEAVAHTEASVLVLGQSGVGKEMIARAIHANSPRADKPLIKVNCASIPKDLFESEFFGHVKGAFTGAHRDRTGRMQLADGGTLFLDEVGEIPLGLQGKLLRALQEGEFERVGDDRTASVNVRIVAATNRDLEQEVAAGRFREDLYYRLSVFPMEVPALRERVDDIALLATHFLQSICVSLGRKPLRLSSAQAERLKRHDWPGNIRELRNVIERAVILSPRKQLRLDLALGEPELLAGGPSVSDAQDTPSEDFLTELEFRDREKQNLIAALRAADWQVWGPEGAAARLGIKPSTLSYRMNRFGIKRE